MLDEFMVSGYCRVMDGSRILVCEVNKDEIDTGCKYPRCDFKDSCDLIKLALARWQEEQEKS